MSRVNLVLAASEDPFIVYALPCCVCTPFLYMHPIVLHQKALTVNIRRRYCILCVLTAK